MIEGGEVRPEGCIYEPSFDIQRYLKFDRVNKYPSGSFDDVRGIVWYK